MEIAANPFILNRTEISFGRLGPSWYY
jgi:hypothetical protein